MLIAIVASIAINVVVIGSGIIRALPVREHDEPATRVVLETRPPQLPTPPPPTPPPTPKPKPVVVVHPQPVRTIVVVAAPTAKPRRRLGGSARPKELAATAPTAPPNGATPAAGTGIAAGGTGTGAGPGNGNGGGNGSGTEQPCGYVRFAPVAGSPTYVGRKWYERIQAIVQYPDGHIETGTFPYQWVYPTQTADPFSPVNAHKNDPVPMQTPPPGFDMSGANSVVQFVVSHTRPDGRTVLPLCPGQRTSD